MSSLASSLSSSNSAAWHHVKEPSYSEFREQWWGKWTQLDVLIKSKNIPLGNSFVVNKFLTGGVDDLLGMYKRIESLYNTKRARGVILTGQPGCGKTLALLFFLICQLAIGRPILFTKALKKTYFFNGSGVWEANLSDLDDRDIPSGPVWSLIDSDRVMQEPPDEITKYCFPIHAVSPNQTRYKDWRKQLQPHMLFMNPWSIEDLMGWVQVEPQFRDSPIDQDQLRALVDVCGPVPRDILAQVRGISTAAQISTELHKLQIDDFRKQLADFTTSPSQSSHKLIIVWGYINPFYEDSYTIDFKSLYVANQIYERWRVLKEEEAVRFYHLCRGNAESSYLAGWVFESIAIRYASGELDHRRTLTDYNVLQVTEEGSVLQCADINLISHLTPAVVDALAKTRRDINQYTEISDIPISAHLLYVPQGRKNYLLDAFFLEVPSPRKIVIWILKMTSSKTKRHEGSARGYDSIRALKALLEITHPGLAISINYVLIVPLLQYAVSWRLPESWTDDIAGQVYVQYMDMAEATNGV
ncbi:hypothetical protein B0H11DRAFT_2060269 [Mycena galericulata]|nr:hypothetical protein B0H11DRAFT_2060269 [Mycena galericulata]